MSILPSNSFYSSYARKRKGAGNVPLRGATGIISPGTSTGLYPAAPKPPAPAPAAPSSPSGPPQGFTVTQGGLPPDPAYQATIGGLTQTKTDTIAGLQQQRGAYLSAEGYIEDPTTHAITFDPNNPYSQAALLRKHYQEAKTGNQNSYADSGQGYAGSLSNAQNAATDSYNASDNAITRAVINFLANNTTQQTIAGDTYNTGAGQALATSVQNAPTNPLYAPSSGAGGGTISGDANGNMAVTGGSKLNPGWSVVYGPDGKPLYFIDPQGNKQGGY